MGLGSKTLNKIDESAKEFIMNLLENDQTHGFDVDSIYYTNKGWVILELLKCDSIYATPYTSHPNRYPWNWKKFVCLYELCKKLNGELWLINYSFKDSDKDLVKLRIVESIDYNQLKYYIQNGSQDKYLKYIKTKDYNYTFEEFKKFFKNLNNSARLPISMYY